MSQHLKPVEPETADLFAPPPEEAGLVVGTIEGPDGWWHGFGAGLRVWCGPLHGWRDFGDLIGLPRKVEAPPKMSMVTWHQRRLSGSLHWDLGAAKKSRVQDEEVSHAD